MKHVIALTALLSASAAHSATVGSVTVEGQFSPSTVSVEDTSDFGFLGGTVAETNTNSIALEFDGFETATAGIANATLTRISVQMSFSGTFSTSLVGTLDSPNEVSGLANYTGFVRLRLEDIFRLTATFSDDLACTSMSTQPVGTCTASGSQVVAGFETNEVSHPASLSRFTRPTFNAVLTTNVSADLQEGRNAGAAVLFDGPAPSFALTYTYSTPDTPAVPLPAAGWALLTGLGALTVLRKKSQRSA